MLEFDVATETSGGSGFATGAAIQVMDGQTLFQIDFLYDGATRNVGLLKQGGNPSVPGDHFVAASPVDYTHKTLRLTVDPRRSVIELFDVADLLTPLASWTFDRMQLPASASTRIVVGLPVTSTTAVGTMDVYSVRYSYIYQAWESRDGDLPDAASPGFLQSVVEGDPGSASFVDEELEIECAGGETLFYVRSALSDPDRGGVVEARVRVTNWHPGTRTGAMFVLDDGALSYIVSFVETDEGRFACVPLAANIGDYQEYAGESGLGAELSVKVDWTESHTYRLEHKPRDGVYLYIDGVLELSLPYSKRYEFPSSLFGSAVVGFGQYKDEGSTSVWSFFRTCFGSGFEVSTRLNFPDAEVVKRLNGAKVFVVVTGTGSVVPVTLYVVRHTISQPTNGSDFSVSLPVPIFTDYAVTGTSVSGSNIPKIACPNETAGDRTSSEFRVVTSVALDDGDVLEFVIAAFEV